MVRGRRTHLVSTTFHVRCRYPADVSPPDSLTSVPLFPLATALVPGLVLPLHIFEPRYRLMVEELLEQEPESRMFALISPRPGREPESEGAEALCDVGVLVLLRDTYRHDDGRFDISTVGQRRFRVVSVDNSAPLLRADICLAPDLDEEGEPLLNARVRTRFATYRRTLAENMGVESDFDDDLPDEPLILSYLITASLVIEPLERYSLLKHDSVIDRLTHCEQILMRETALLQSLHSVPALDLLITPSSN